MASVGGIALIVLLVVATPVFATSSAQQRVSLSIQGAIISSGIQVYQASGGQGDLVVASIQGQKVNPKTASFSYEVQAVVVGNVVQGTAQVSLSGWTKGHQPIKLSGTVALLKMTPAESFPLGCGGGSYQCTSSIPAFYNGTGSFQISSGGSEHVSIPMSFESAFLNPYGGALVFASLDVSHSIMIVANYSKATVQWSGVQTAGSITGLIQGIHDSSQSVSGSFFMTTSASENLFAGTEQEHGTIAFSGVSPTILDVAGTYQGSSMIPRPGIDCSYLTNFLGTCSLTGFQSRGNFNMADLTQRTQLTGTYSITWDVPAVAFCLSLPLIPASTPCSISATLT